MRTALTQSRARRQRQQGLAVMVVIALLAITSLYVAANARTLHYLKRNVALVEQKQVRHWQARDRASGHGAVSMSPGRAVAGAAATNSVSVAGHE